MKANQIEDALKQRGMERGTLYVLTALAEQINSIERAMIGVTKTQIAVVDSLQNVVNGTAMMKSELMKELKKSGMMVNAENADDGLGDSTHMIGEK